MANLQEQLEKAVQEHNELHNNIQAGEDQIASMKQARDRLVGRIQLLQELAQEEQAEPGADALPTETPAEVAPAQPAA